MSKIGYLQPVNESPTELPAMYTVLKRSQHFGYTLGLSEIDCVFDQACYAKACQIKWASPNEFKDLSCRLGSFHTIPVLISAIFKRFGDAGLVDIITESNIIASGSLNGIINGHHYNRAVRTLKLIYEAMSRLQWKQFGEYLKGCENLDLDVDLIEEKVLQIREDFSSDECHALLNSSSMAKLSQLFQEFRASDRGPMFKLWTSFLQIVEIMLLFIRACREGDWELHLNCFRQMLPWFFAYDHTNYARYGAYYYCSMKVLGETHPQIHEQLLNGHFGVQMSNVNTFGKIPFDQAIEETINKSSKIPGGIVGKSTNQEAVSQWIDTTADRSQITENIRILAGLNSNEASWTHKEGTAARVKRDDHDTKTIVSTVDNMLDPFLHSNDLTSISTGIKASTATVSDLFSAHTKGEKHLQDFIQQRILTNDVPYFAPLTKLKLKTFSNETAEKSVKVGGKELIVKADRNFFCKLVVIAKTRELDLYQVYSYELGPVPWSIATQYGTLYKTDKSKLLEDLEKNVPYVQQSPQGAVWIFDVFANIQVLKPVPTHHQPIPQRELKWKPKTFSNVAESVLSSICRTTLPQPARIDFVVDSYHDISIKNTERERRSKSKGRRIKITNGTQKAPSDWNDFMSNSSNKKDLPEFLLKEWTADAEGKYAQILQHTTMFMCHGMHCHRLRVSQQSIEAIEVPALFCRAEEADTRMFLHAKHVANVTACPAIVIRSSDTDVMALAIYFQKEIDSQLLMQRQTKKIKWKFVDIASIKRQLGPDICDALPGFHAFSGCDTTSGFNGKGKKGFFKLLSSNENFREAMKKLGDDLDVNDDLLSSCEAAICKLYGSNCTDVNQVRYEMLSKGAESHDIPPTKDALILHTKRSNFQAYVWKRALDANFETPSPNGYGWKIKQDTLQIEWMTKEPAPKAVLEFVSCKSCKKCNTRRCPCKNRGFQCTDSCGCDVHGCENSEDSGRFYANGLLAQDDVDMDLGD